MNRQIAFSISVICSGSETEKQNQRFWVTQPGTVKQGSLAIIVFQVKIWPWRIKIIFELTIKL